MLDRKYGLSDVGLIVKTTSSTVCLTVTAPVREHIAFCNTLILGSILSYDQAHDHADQCFQRFTIKHMAFTMKHMALQLSSVELTYLFSVM